MEHDKKSQGKIPAFLDFYQNLIWLKLNWKRHWKFILKGALIFLIILTLPVVWTHLDPLKEKLPISPDKTAPTVTVDTPTTVSELLKSNVTLDRNRLEFDDSLDFYSWLSKKPKLIIKSKLVVNDINDLLCASQITLEKNGEIISKHNNPIHLLTLSFKNNNGRIISEPLQSVPNNIFPKKADPGTSYNPKCHNESCNKRAFANGGAGQPGKIGRPGGIGGDGGKLILASVSITGPLNISLPGGKGGKGGIGGQGGDGGNGKGGSRGDGKAVNCACGGRNGGSGGNSGMGGKGGPGGIGGKGGSVQIVTTKKYSANSKITFPGGEGGDGGEPGKPGKPGRKGKGCPADLWCSKTHSGANGKIPNPPNLGIGVRGPWGAEGQIDQKVLQLKSNQENYDGFYLWVTRWHL